MGIVVSGVIFVFVTSNDMSNITLLSSVRLTQLAPTNMVCDGIKSPGNHFAHCIACLSSLIGVGAIILPSQFPSPTVIVLPVPALLKLT